MRVCVVSQSRTHIAHADSFLDELLEERVHRIGEENFEADELEQVCVCVSVCCVLFVLCVCGGLDGGIVY